MKLGYPLIRKAALVCGDTLRFRDASIDDAEFILALRTDKNTSRFLNKTSEDIRTQRDWLQRYATHENQAYFIIECEGVALGTVRLLDARGSSFCWGSWILKERRPRNAVLESLLMVFSYAVDDLGFEASHFEVRKSNDRLIRFYERFGATRVCESEENYFYSIDRDAILAMREKLRAYLSKDIVVFRS